MATKNARFGWAATVVAPGIEDRYGESLADVAAALRLWRRAEVSSARSGAGGVLLLGFAGAMRRSELVGLDVADVTEVDEGLLVARRSRPAVMSTATTRPGSGLRPERAPASWPPAADKQASWLGPSPANDSRCIERSQLFAEPPQATNATVRAGRGVPCRFGI